VPATELQEFLGGGYGTAWFLEHRIREALIPGDRGETSTPPEHSRYATAYRAEARWRASAGTPETRFRSAVLALLEAEPLHYRQLVSRPGPA
jgi:hypothetical protein